MILVSALKKLLNQCGYGLSRWPSATERLEPQSVACAREFNIEGIIDVGAHRGEFCLAIAQFLPIKVMHLFEPDPQLRLPRASSFPSVSQYCIYRKAVHSSPGIKTLNFYKSPDFNSLLLPTEFGESHFLPSLDIVGTQKIRVDSLSNLLSPCLDRSVRYLLKIDAQGVDHDVLAGALDVLSCVDVICMEVSFRPVYEGQPLFQDTLVLLSGLGFSLSSLTPVTRLSDRSLIEANAVFVRSVGT